ncbi:hypothetical protein [Acrocarpospora sp. B8E8]|uniref:hypothetical protein n=1 Tax=Acrocarpospora sp. B8E8 TaxID=3153572 RepID=UPI00325DF94A
MANRRLIAVLTAIIAVLVAVIVVMIVNGGDDDRASPAGAVSTPSPVSPSAQTPVASPAVQTWAKGQCLNAAYTVNASPGVVSVVPCEDAQAKSRIIAVTAQCPAETDGLRHGPEVPTGRTACVRNLAAPHPGDPGKGGGILRPGDCVYIAEPSDTKDTDPQERPCHDRYGPGKIWNFYQKKSQCKDADGFLDNHYTNRRDHPTKPVICTTGGYDVETPGAQYAKGICVRKPASFAGGVPGWRNVIGGLDEVGCRSKRAWAKVVGSVSAQNCPSGTTDTLSSIDWYPGTTCLRRL